MQKQFGGEKIVVSTSGARAFDSHSGGKILNLSLTTYMKISSKWIIGINVKCKSIKLLFFQDLGLCKKVLILDTKSTIIKRKN